MPAEQEFGDFSAGGSENPVLAKGPPKDKNDAWELGSKLFNLDDLNEVKEDKNALLDKGFGSVLGKTEHVGNNLLATKGEDLNMLWNAPMMSSSSGYSGMSGAPMSGGMHGAMGGMPGGAMSGGMHGAGGMRMPGGGYPPS